METLKVLSASDYFYIISNCEKAEKVKEKKLRDCLIVLFCLIDNYILFRIDGEDDSYIEFESEEEALKEYEAIR